MASFNTQFLTVVADRVKTALDRSPTWVAVRTRYRPGDGQPRCPVCYDSDYSQASKALCTTCYGTGWDGGYAPTVLVKGSVANSTEDFEMTAGGYLKIRKTQSNIGPTPILHRGDIVASVIVDDSTPPNIVSVLDKFQVGNVNHQRFDGSVVVSQLFDAAVVQDSEPEAIVPMEVTP